jgi:hypothetical protein
MKTVILELKTINKKTFLIIPTMKKKCRLACVFEKPPLCSNAGADKVKVFGLNDTMEIKNAA